MTHRDPTEDLLRQYFAERVEEFPSVALPGESRPNAREASGGGGGFRLIMAKIAIAAAVVLTIYLPLTEKGRNTPSARGLAAIHAELDTGRVIREGLRKANAFMTTHFSGDESHD